MPSFKVFFKKSKKEKYWECKEVYYVTDCFKLIESILEKTNESELYLRVFKFRDKPKEKKV